MGAPEQSGGQGRKPEWPAHTRKRTQPPWAAVGQPYGGLHKGAAGMALNSSWARTFPRVKMPMASTQCGHESVSEPHVTDPGPQSQVWPHRQPSCRPRAHGGGPAGPPHQG